MSQPVKLSILASDRKRRNRWARWVAESKHLQAVASADASEEVPAPPARLPDVIIADRWPLDRLDAESQQHLAAGEVGLILVGSQGPADVWFADDPPPGELLLACRLLAQIVQLRRQHKKHKQIVHALRQLAMTDPLTGIANRRGWDQSLRRLLGEVQQQQDPACVAIVDLDHFKRINDQYGHAVGDEVLQAVAAQLQRTLRKQDLAARLGGDEFGLLLVGVGPQQAVTIVEQIRVQATQVQLPSEAEVAIQLTASAGYTILDPEQCQSPELVYHRADQALLQAKHRGRNRTVAGSL